MDIDGAASFPSRASRDLVGAIEAWFSSRGWKIFPFQREVWEACCRGESGLVHSATGSGKTLAVWFGALISGDIDRNSGLRLVWITPLRALASDTELALSMAAEAIGSGWTVGRRTGDSTSTAKRRAVERPPSALITTPESLCVLLSQPAFVDQVASLEMVVVDEWHELLSTKRGVLTELALARLRALTPGVLTWGLSATLGNTGQAAEVLGGIAPSGEKRPMRLVSGVDRKVVRIDSVLPDAATHLPWAGHLGLQLLPKVVSELSNHRSAIVFTNTRSHAELWHNAMREAVPDWAVGLHHGSLSEEERDGAEEGLRTGRLRVVVATSSLDLGVDFSPVDCVVQIGSPKGVARLMQRAGRSGHQPGAVSRILCVPANTFELAEIAATRDYALRGIVESRRPLRRPIDVLCQHLVTVAAGGGFDVAGLLDEVRSTTAFEGLSDAEWQWALDFASGGGPALRAYPEYGRLEAREGRILVRDDAIAKRHRTTIGTISSEASVSVVLSNGRNLGTVEEGFIAALKPGQKFLFAGRCLELVRVREMRATVKPARGKPQGVPRWMGGRLPLSSCLSEGIRERLSRAKAGDFADSSEMERLQPVLELQEMLSKVPDSTELLIERFRSREGHHLFIYPFDGRLVHEGLAALFAYRLAKISPITFSFAMNDYGFELVAATPAHLEQSLEAGLLAEENLLADTLASLHAAELSRRKFREIARIAGLIRDGFGRERKSARQLQVSAGLLFDVFRKYDPENLLLDQATMEVLEAQLEHTRMRESLSRLRSRKISIVEVETLTPLSYPLFVDRLREQLSSEALAERIRRIEEAMEERGRKARGH